MPRKAWFYVAKALEGVGMVIVLVGVFWSISLGFEDQGLKSMGAEMRGLVLGGLMFVAGVAIERALGTR